ncbi:hypothetical protein RHGRI_033123 [Rhododendron griersonianum]|uniref:PB1 domain-containing protein n=1 Tax=Rhododendron griersonianum TaxID=479676 RepID=A0AAV6I139_9ERIC|nr:hypothetical protein RHGRI_033123 [Rhododendron griersonianum]
MGSRQRVSSLVLSLLFSHHPLLLLLLLITATCPTFAALSSSNFPSVSAGAYEDKAKMDSLILLCNYRGESCGIRIFHNNSYAQLVNKLIVRWSGLKAGEVGLSYSLETDRFCMLRNDDDLDVMFELVSSSGLNRVKVSVFDAGSTSGGGGGSNSGCGGAGGDQQLAILQSSLSHPLYALLM